MAVGKTKIFLKLGAQQQLEQSKRLAYGEFVLTIQRFYRGFRARKSMKKVLKVLKEGAGWLKEFVGKRMLYGFGLNAKSYKVEGGANVDAGADLS